MRQPQAGSKIEGRRRGAALGAPLARRRRRMASDEPEAAGRRRWFRILGSAHDKTENTTTDEVADPADQVTQLVESALPQDDVGWADAAPAADSESEVEGAPAEGSS